MTHKRLFHMNGIFKVIKFYIGEITTLLLSRVLLFICVSRRLIHCFSSKMINRAAVVVDFHSDYLFCILSNTSFVRSLKFEMENIWRKFKCMWESSLSQKFFACPHHSFNSFLFVRKKNASREKRIASHFFISFHIPLSFFRVCRNLFRYLDIDR